MHYSNFADIGAPELVLRTWVGGWGPGPSEVTDLPLALLHLDLSKAMKSPKKQRNQEKMSAMSYSQT